LRYDFKLKTARFIFVVYEMKDLLSAGEYKR